MQQRCDHTAVGFGLVYVYREMQIASLHTAIPSDYDHFRCSFFLMVVMRLSETFLQPLNRAQHAFRKQYSTQEVLHILRNHIEKAKEWQEHIFIGDGYVENAYDNTEHAHIVNALIADGCPKDLVAAMARGLRSRVKFKIGRHITGEISKHASNQSINQSFIFKF